MAHSKTRANDGKITYPPGVKEISDKISKEEMVRRLKVSMQVTVCRFKFPVYSISDPITPFLCLQGLFTYFFPSGFTLSVLSRKKLLPVVPTTTFLK